MSENKEQCLTESGAPSRQPKPQIPAKQASKHKAPDELKAKIGIH